jgi:nicotinate-nucleotide adenylyltransferase
MRIGVLGGSFDPIHNAHLIVARLACEQLRLDRVLFVVASVQPFKSGSHGASAADRYRMVERAVAGIPDFVADRRELDRDGPSYTVDTLRELAGEHPRAELFLVMGADVAARMAGWREPDEIRRLARLAVCQRGGSSVAGLVQLPSGETVPADRIITVPAIDISSTAIRSRAAAGQLLDGWVPRQVADYIVASRLYVE